MKSKRMVEKRSKEEQTTYQNGVKKRMNNHASQTKYHIAEVVDELMIGDNFQQVLFQCAMISH